MNEELKNLEAELARLKPRQPGAGLKTRIAENLARVEPVVPHHAFNGWKTLLAAAASIAVVLGILHLQPVDTSPPVSIQKTEPTATTIQKTVQPVVSHGKRKDLRGEIFRPARIKTAVLACRNEEIVESPRKEPFLKRSCQMVDQIEWISLDGKRKIKVTRPRKEVILTKLASI